jgi:hypothetical protein
MVRRVIIGTRGSEKGMWITTAGKDALTSTVQEDFLVDTTRKNTQPRFKGIIINPTLSYQGTTRYTTYETVAVCTEYAGYYGPPGGYRSEWKCDKNGENCKFEAVYYANNTWYTYCKTYGTENSQVDHPGVATYQATIAHNLGYLPQSILSSTTEYPGSPCPNIFIDENNIYLRYYEADVGYTASGIVFTASKPSTYTLYVTVHYTLLAQAA